MGARLKKVGRTPKHGVAMTAAERQAARMARLKAAAILEPQDLKYALEAGCWKAAYTLLQLAVKSHQKGWWYSLDKMDAERTAGLLRRLSAAQPATARQTIQAVIWAWPEMKVGEPAALAFVDQEPVA